LKLKYDDPLSTFAFKFKLRRYNKDSEDFDSIGSDESDESDEDDDDGSDDGDYPPDEVQGDARQRGVSSVGGVPAPLPPGGSQGGRPGPQPNISPYSLPTNNSR